MLYAQDLPTISARLRILGFTSLGEFYASEKWLIFKIKSRPPRKKFRCSCCEKGEDLQLHHVTYERLGEEQPGDTVWVCGECHEQIHLSYLNMGPWHPGLLREATEFWRSIFAKHVDDADLPPSMFRHKSGRSRKKEKEAAALKRMPLIKYIGRKDRLWRTNPS